MKKIIYLLFISVFLASCVNEKMEDREFKLSNKVDTSALVVESARFQQELVDFNNSALPVVKGNVHTRADINGKIEQTLDLDSVSLKQLSSGLLHLDEEALSLFNAAGLTTSEVDSLMNDSVSVGQLAVAGVLFSSIIHDEYSEEQTRGVFNNKYIDCAVSALGLDIPFLAGSIYKKGVKAVAKICLKMALTGASGGAGVVVFVCGYALCISGY